MLNFRSQENYHSLKKFLSSDMKWIQNILISDLFSQKEMEYILLQMKEEFSQDFLECLKIGRQSFFGQDLVWVLSKLYNELEYLYERQKCIIITAYLMNDLEKTELEEALKQKFESQYNNLEFIYEYNKDIIGGMIIKIDQQYYDASFKKVLSNLKLMIKEDIQ